MTASCDIRFIFGSGFSCSGTDRSLCVGAEDPLAPGRILIRGTTKMLLRIGTMSASLLRALPQHEPSPPRASAGLLMLFVRMEELVRLNLMTSLCSYFTLLSSASGSSTDFPMPRRKNATRLLSRHKRDTSTSHASSGSQRKACDMYLSIQTAVEAAPRPTIR